MRKLFILYSAKACCGAGTDDACVFVSCDSMKEAHSFKRDFGSCACYSYDIVPGEEREQLVNETWEWDWHP